MKNAAPKNASVEFHLLGPVRFEACQSLQRRLLYEAGASPDQGTIRVLVTEHESMISVGRRGSRAHIRLPEAELRRRGLEVRWMARAGGCVMHGPGQLAVFVIAPLAWHGWSVTDYLARLQQGLQSALDELQYRTRTVPGRYSLWGRTGQLANINVAVRSGITCQGLFLNVDPAMELQGTVDVAGEGLLPEGYKRTMGSLLAEKQRPVKMSAVRATLVPQLAEALGCPRYHMHTGHPLLCSEARIPSEPIARVS